MFRRNKKEVSNVLPETVAETLRTKRLELTKRCGELADAAAVAFNHELTEARARGLSVEDQEAYLKNLWEERKIPRISVQATWGHGLSVHILNVTPENTDALLLRELDKHDPDRAPYAGTTPQVVVDPVKLAASNNGQGLKYEDCIPIDINIVGYLRGNISEGTMGEPSQEYIDHLLTIEAQLLDASALSEVSSRPVQ